MCQNNRRFEGLVPPDGFAATLVVFEPGVTHVHYQTCMLSAPAACLGDPPAVNPAGTYFTFDEQTKEPGVATCPANTYGPGLRKQRACVPCPSGYTTDFIGTNGVITQRTGQASKSACGKCTARG
jgi:hypothetical protein